MSSCPIFTLQQDTCAEPTFLIQELIEGGMFYSTHNEVFPLVAHPCNNSHRSAWLLIFYEETSEIHLARTINKVLIIFKTQIQTIASIHRINFETTSTELDLD